ncbi:hypothetical protein QBC32DRAFT_337796 [Pseudoneurospora amorphoporcata]|uniref:Uncharacterized protein n=1 Tax=Pseudoneurospora amorphoporcata TaxID=241081 RepID=A0AAN6NXH9_9PEZI|nr:hypothetical protein QBC32DRAFT_337796 [Pseudoneurospora amorphoporcata]
MAIKYRQLGDNNDPDDNLHKYFELGCQKFLRDLSKSPEKRDDAVLPTVAWPVQGLRATRSATGSSSIPAPPHTVTPSSLCCSTEQFRGMSVQCLICHQEKMGIKASSTCQAPCQRTIVNNSNNTSHMRPELNPPSLSIL